MDIIINSSCPEYGRLSVELLFSYTLNLKGVGFNSHTKPKRNWVSLRLHSRIVSDGGTIAQCRVGRGRVTIWIRVGCVHALTQLIVGGGHATPQSRIGHGRAFAQLRVWRDDTTWTWTKKKHNLILDYNSHAMAFK